MSALKRYFKHCNELDVKPKPSSNEEELDSTPMKEVRQRRLSLGTSLEWD